jgi:hypothetical protein
VVSIACGLATPQLDRIELRLNGSMVWRGEVVGSPTPVFTRAAPLHPGANTLEICAENGPSRAPGDPRALGFAVYNVAISTERRRGEARSVTDDGALRPASTPAPLGDPARGRGYAEPAHVTDVGELTALLREPDAHRARLRGDVKRLTALLQESDADRAARLDQAHELSRLLQESDADRAARLDQVHELSRLLQESDADRAARLDQVHELLRLLQESEADRAARFEFIQNLEAQVASLQARLERMERAWVWRCDRWLHSWTTGRNPGE